MGVIYGPNVDDPTFFNNIETIIESMGNKSILLGGDWNVVQNFNLDTLNYKHNNNQNAQGKQAIRQCPPSE